MHPTAGIPVNSWGRENFVTVIKKLSELYKLSFVIIGSENECYLGAKIIKEIGPIADNVINLMGECNYSESAELFKRCKLLISCDSGPVHLSAAVGTPVVGIYSSRNVR